MSLLRGAKEFFGLAPNDEDFRDDAYYDEPRYADDGAAAYAPRYEREPYEREVAPVVERGPEPVRSYVPSVVTVAPSGYHEATAVGDPFRDGDAVIFDLSNVEHDAAKRFIDFAAGLCFALYGQMHNLSKGIDTTRRVFAIVPSKADITLLELQSSARLR